MIQITKEAAQSVLDHIKRHYTMSMFASVADLHDQKRKNRDAAIANLQAAIDMLAADAQTVELWATSQESGKDLHMKSGPRAKMASEMKRMNALGRDYWIKCHPAKGDAPEPSSERESLIDELRQVASGKLFTHDHQEIACRAADMLAADAQEIAQKGFHLFDVLTERDALQAEIDNLKAQQVAAPQYASVEKEEAVLQAAWRALKPGLTTEVWTVSDSFTFRGFFAWGWEARRQYRTPQAGELSDSEIDAIWASVALDVPPYINFVRAVLAASIETKPQ